MDIISTENASDIPTKAKQCDDAMFTKLSKQAEFGCGFQQLERLQACHWQPLDQYCQ